MTVFTSFTDAQQNRWASNENAKKDYNAYPVFTYRLFTSAMEDVQSSLSVWLSVSNCGQKLLNGFAWYFQGRLAMGQWTNNYILVAIRITDLLQIGIHIATLVRRALAEVCTVPVLLVVCLGNNFRSKWPSTRLRTIYLACWFLLFKFEGQDHRSKLGLAGNKNQLRHSG